MKPLRVFKFLSAVIMFMTFSCSKEETNYQSHLLNVIYIDDFGNCFDFSNSKLGYIIENDSSYQSIGDSSKIKYSANCDTAKLLHIDFSIYTLLGISTTSSLCDSISRVIFLDTISKKYIYNIGIKHNKVDWCLQIAKTSMNWALVPKLPKEYKVEFIITLDQ